MLEYYSFLIFKLMIGFGLIIIYLYLTGKYQLSKMTPIDFIGNFIIGGAVGGVIYSDSITIPTYVITLIIALIIVYLISMVSDKFSAAKAITVGIPLVIIKDKQFCIETISENKNKIDFSNILSKLHQQGIKEFSELEYLQLEPTGEIIAVKQNEQIPSVIIYENDTFLTYNLDRINLAEEKIQRIIDLYQIENIVLIEYTDKKLHILTDNKTETVSLSSIIS